MRRITALIVASAFMLSVLCSCTISPNTTPSDGSSSNTDTPGMAETTDSKLLDVLIGEAITMKAMADNGGQLVNNSGMSGLWSSNHLHAAFDGSNEKGREYIEECMYVTDTAQQPVFFDLGSVQALGQLCIWNYGDISDLDSGVKEVQIFYSEDNVEYIHFGTFSLTKASAEDAEKHGGFMASTVEETGLPIDFGGISARFIGIAPITNHGGSKYGMSEVRIFRHKTRPSDGDLIFGESFTPRAETNAENLTNNTGMSTVGATLSSDETADNTPSHMWYSSQGAEQSMVIVNLDGTYPIDTLKIWNYNDPNNLGVGIKNVDIFYTTGEACGIHTSQTEQDYYDFDSGNWKRLGRYTIPQGTGENELKASLEIDLEGKHIQHLKIVPVDNYKDKSDEFGLSEVRVYSSSGWAIEPARLWSGVVNTSGSFAYHGNSAEDPFATRDQGSGWIGADGIFSTSLNGGQLQGSINENSVTLFTFQDSFIGNMGNYRVLNMQQGYGNSPGFSIGMRNMAYMFLRGNLPDVRNVQYYWELNNGLSKQYDGENILPGRYWISDSTVIDGKVYTLANKFEGLTVLSKDLYIQNIDETGIINMNEFATMTISDPDNSLPGNMNFEPLYEEGEYIYQYGRKDNRLVVRRTTVEEYKTLSGWRYWNGSNWVQNASDAKKISEKSIGNEFNVTYMETGAFAGKYIAVYTEGSIWGTVTCAVSDSITGPFERLDKFSDTKSLYWATERYEFGMNNYKDSKNYYVQWNYNAKSQPAISAENELLITYHFGLHDDRVPSWGFFNALGKEYEQPTFIKLIEIKE